MNYEDDLSEQYLPHRCGSVGLSFSSARDAGVEPMGLLA